MEISQAKPLRRRAELFGATAECAIRLVAIVKSPGRTAVYVDNILKGTMRANRCGLGRLPKRDTFAGRSGPFFKRLCGCVGQGAAQRSFWNFLPIRCGAESRPLLKVLRTRNDGVEFVRS
jgi:hypothetical protein